MTRKSLSYEERERRRKEQLAFNETYLTGFADHLRRKGISEKTVDKHLDNVSLFLNVYLLDEDVPPLPGGCFLMDDYLGRYLIERPAYTSPAMISESATSLKRFYKYMLEEDQIRKEDYGVVLEDIRLGWPMWRDACRENNDKRHERFEGTGRRAVADPRRCSMCDSLDVRTFNNGLSFCLECYNERMSADLGVSHFTDVGLHFFQPDDRGMPVRFEVEHMLLGDEVQWTARETVEEGDARLRDGYEGLEVQLFASAYDDPASSRGSLIEKTERRMRTKSLSISKNVAKPGEIWGGCVQRGRDVITAADRGIARIELDGYGNMSFIVDGYRFMSGDFLQLIARAEGFDLHWEIKDASEDLPEL